MSPPIDPRWRSAALAAADAAAVVTSLWFRATADADVEHKPGAASPIVTIADREAEQAMRRVLSAQLPEHAIFGEEEGASGGGAGNRYTWVLDPIDGTIAFASGKPLFTTLIALCEDHRPILGVIDQPILGERWIGTLDGTTLNNATASTRAPQALSAARLASTLPLTAPDDRAAFERVAAQVHVTTWGGDAYNYALLASGHVHLVVESGLEWYDWAALVPVVQGAGGVITDWTGAPLSKTTGLSRVVAAASPALHEQALRLIQSS